MQYCNISGIVAVQDDSFGPDTCFSSLPFVTNEGRPGVVGSIDHQCLHASHVIEKSRINQGTHSNDSISVLGFGYLSVIFNFDNNK